MSIQSFFEKINSILNDPKIGEKINTGLDSLNDSINQGISSIEDSVNEVINEVSSKINSNNTNSDRLSPQVDENNMSDNNNTFIDMGKTSTGFCKVSELVNEDSEELVDLNYPKNTSEVEDIPDIIKKQEDFKKSVEGFEEVIRPSIDTSKPFDNFKPSLNLDKEIDKNEEK